MDRIRNRLHPLILISITAILSACSKNDLSPIDNVYRITGTILSDEVERRYVLNLPSNYYEASDFPLVIAMHGGAGSAQQFESTSRFTEKANSSKFIVVYPEGIQRPGLLKLQTWNAGACCGYAVENNVDDVKYISTLIDELISTFDIDSEKIYATGHSNGGMMAYRLACELSDKIKAIAPNASTMVTSNCNPDRSVPILHMHSELDSKIPYQGGIGSGVGTIGIELKAIDSVLDFWSLNNNCTDVANVLVDNVDYRHTKWSNCNENVSIDYYLTKDGGHGWPGGLPDTTNGDNASTAIKANDLLWDFFQQY